MATTETVSEITIRPMQAKDIEAVVQIENSAYFAPWPKIAFTASLDKYPAFVMEKNGSIVGYALFSAVHDEAHILNFVIAPHEQKQGLGRQLLHFVLAQLWVLNVVHVSLEVALNNQAAMHLYQAVGFKRAGVRKDYYQTAQGREDALILVYTCAQSFSQKG